MPRQHDTEIPRISAPTLADALERVRREHARDRVLRLDLDGRRVWMKQSEHHESLRKRISKGDGTAALSREAATLRELAARGIAVPEVIASTDEHLLLSDSGRTVNDMMFRPDYRVADGVAACRAAGRAVAQLHLAGLALGRGKAKDHCWDGERIIFIDLEVPPEPFDARRNGRRGLVNFVFDLHFIACRLRRDAHFEAQAFLQGYAEADRPETRAAIEAARTWARRRGWLGALALPLSFLRPPGRSPDLMATVRTLVMLAEIHATIGTTPDT